MIVVANHCRIDANDPTITVCYPQVRKSVYHFYINNMISLMQNGS